jgi:hypothetical protein
MRGRVVGQPDVVAAIEPLRPAGKPESAALEQSDAQRRADELPRQRDAGGATPDDAQIGLDLGSCRNRAGVRQAHAVHMSG